MAVGKKTKQERRLNTRLKRFHEIIPSPKFKYHKPGSQSK